MSTYESIAKDAQDERTYDWLVEIGATCKLCGMVIPGERYDPDDEGYGYCSARCEWEDKE